MYLLVHQTAEQPDQLQVHPTVGEVDVGHPAVAGLVVDHRILDGLGQRLGESGLESVDHAHQNRLGQHLDEADNTCAKWTTPVSGIGVRAGCFVSVDH